MKQIASLARHYTIARLLLLKLILVSPLLTAQTLDSLKLHSVGIAVSDVGKSTAFYQSLLGLPLQGQAGETVFLRLGNGPQYLSLTPVAAGDSPRITYIGLSARNFNSNAFIERLTANGFSAGKPGDGSNGSRLSLAKTFWLEDGVLHFVDSEGVEIQLSDTAYCGSTSFNCDEPLATPAGKLTLTGINHFTTFMSNAPQANNFYQTLLGLGIQSYQGPTVPTLAVGDGLQFLMFVGPAQEGAPKNPANLHHVSFVVADFDVEGIFSTLKDYGLTARPEGVNTAAPLQYYVSLRMPARGGAEGGTPEVYLTDPDGILLQVQDARYCGGGGYLGDEC